MDARTHAHVCAYLPAGSCIRMHASASPQELSLASGLADLQRTRDDVVAEVTTNPPTHSRVRRHSESYQQHRSKLQEACLQTTRPLNYDPQTPRSSPSARIHLALAHLRVRILAHADINIFARTHSHKHAHVHTQRHTHIDVRTHIPGAQSAKAANRQHDYPAG